MKAIVMENLQSGKSRKKKSLKSRAALVCSASRYTLLSKNLSPTFIFHSLVGSAYGFFSLLLSRRKHCVCGTRAKICLDFNL